MLCYMVQVSQIDGVHSQTHCIDSPCLKEKLLFDWSKKRDGCMSLLLHIEATPREFDLRSAAQTQSCIAIRPRSCKVLNALIEWAQRFCCRRDRALRPAAPLLSFRCRLSTCFERHACVGCRMSHLTSAVEKRGCRMEAPRRLTRVTDH